MSETMQNPPTGTTGTCTTCGNEIVFNEVVGWYHPRLLHDTHDAAPKSEAAIPEPAPAMSKKSEPVFQGVLDDIRAREAFGVNKYGQSLHTFNGRDALIDAYQEALDLVVYLKQILMERDAKTS